MAIAASGAVSFSDLRTEYSATGAVSFSDFYRGAASNFVRALAANNTATNLSAGVPTSGTINFTNFRSQARGFRFTFTSGATNQSGSGLFGTDWGVDYPKDIIINSGVTLGGTSSSQEALEISTGGLGTITVTNNGTLIGAGGAANGGAGGDAFEAFVACTLTNNGSIIAGGGGGGRGGNGGTGGGGRYTTTGGNTYITFANSGNPCSVSMFGGYNNYVSKYVTQSACCMGEGYRCQLYGRPQSTVNTSGGGGGAGGAGGRGAGYNQTVANGSGGGGGANGGTNAGRGGNGGTGGNGGGFGANGSGGSNGSNGNNGNRTGGGGGAGGAGGGAAGKSIRGISFATLTNNGTITGGQV
jgi:hypothetical protein